MKPFTTDLAYLSANGTEIYRLQQCLEALGYGDFIPTGIFGVKTRSAVIQFQKDHGIIGTGNFGPLTRAKMNTLIGGLGGKILYQTALSFLGRDASPLDKAPDEVACAESVYDVALSAFPGNVGFPFTESTTEIDEDLAKCVLYRKLVPGEALQSGDIIVYPTGKGNGKIDHGHIMIYDAVDGTCMSNNSLDGIFDKHLTRQHCLDYYVKIGGFPEDIYRRI